MELYDRKLVAERLELLRLALDLRPAELARKWGITPQGVYNYLKGDQLPSVAMACKLQEKTGATLDWLYRGNMGSLPSDLADKIDSIKSRPPAVAP